MKMAQLIIDQPFWKRREDTTLAAVGKAGVDAQDVW
jgi:hypothetical protein